jgi:hypothetical protein
VKFFPVTSFLPAMWLLASVLFAGNARAQQLQLAPWNDPDIVWLTPAQAQSAVQNELGIMEPQLADLTPGDPQHTDLLRRIIWYKAILRALTGGAAVLPALESAVPEAASVGGLYEHAFTPKATLIGLFAEAVALLSD